MPSIRIPRHCEPPVVPAQAAVRRIRTFGRWRHNKKIPGRRGPAFRTAAFAGMTREAKDYFAPLVMTANAVVPAQAGTFGWHRGINYEIPAGAGMTDGTELRHAD